MDHSLERSVAERLRLSTIQILTFYQILQLVEDLLPLLDFVEGLSAPEWTLRMGCQRDGGDDTQIVGTSPESLPEISMLVRVGIDDIARG